MSSYNSLNTFTSIAYAWNESFKLSSMRCRLSRLPTIITPFFHYRILHLFPWSGIVDEDSQLSDTFRVPDPKTGQMRRLISQIPPKEEEMFRNMIRRLNTIVKVGFINIPLKYLLNPQISGCCWFRCPYYDWRWTNLFSTSNISHHTWNDAKV